MDEIDIRILAELQENGRLTNHELAGRVGLSSSPCWRRVRRLEEAGIINRYAAILSPVEIGLHVVAFAHVLLESHHTGVITAFDEIVNRHQAVQECFSTSGEYDYLLKVVVPSMEDYERFLSNSLLASGTVRQVNTGFVLKQVKQTTSLPLQTVAGA